MSEESFKEWFYNHRVPIFIDLVSGSVSGICNCLSSHPMDTIKVRMQMSDDGIIRTIKGLAQNEGFQGFYKGMQFPLIAVPLINSCVFTVYEFWRRYFKGSSIEPMNAWQTLVCGAFAGSSAAYLSCTIELAKCRLQMQHETKGKGQYKGPLDCMIKIYKNEGPKYLGRGMYATQFREIFGYASQFVVYEEAKEFLIWIQEMDGPSALDLLISGGLGGVACWAFSYPQDTIKTHLQCETSTAQSERKYKSKYLDGGFWDCYRQIVRKQGQMGLWKGFSACAIRAFYANAIGFYTFELAKEILVDKIQSYE